MSLSLIRNTIKKMLKTSLSLVLVFIFTGCSNNNSKINEQKFFVKGDPLSLLKNTEQTKETIFTKENYKDFHGYRLLSIIYFEEVSESELNNKNQSVEDLERNNPARFENSKRRTSSGFSFEQIDDHYLFSGNISESELKIPFKEAPNGNFIFDLETYESFTHSLVTNTKLEHFSITSNKRLFSLLISQTVPNNGNTLFALYFIKDQETKSLRENISDFIYTNVLNAPLGWEQSETVELNICHSGSDLEIDGLSKDLTISESIIRTWDVALKDRLNVEYKWLNLWKPFSDLNQNCIFFNEDLLRKENPNVFNGGINISISDLSENKTITSDVIIWAKEIAKEYQAYKNVGYDLNNDSIYDLQKSLDSYLIHELGHFFQLDHKFNGPKTVMSYSDDRLNGLYKYDIEAIEYLYPLVN